jgi:predicted ATPase/DNA-binding winged helix-turn-helix (wHTH) protein
MRNQRILRDYSPDPFEVMTAVFAKCTIVRLPISACTARDKELIVLTTGDLEILPDQRRVLVSNKSFNLGSRAYDMLEMLADARGELVSKEEIIRRVWPDTIVVENNLHVQISAIRKMLGTRSDLLVSVPGRGYRLAMDVPRRQHSEVSTGFMTSRVRSAIPASKLRVYGRDLAIEDVASLCRNASLVSLVGPGGIGKTTLAVEAARRLMSSFSEGIWFVELSRVTAAQHVAAAAADVLDGGAKGEESPLQRLATCLSGKNALVVLDNCEHVIEAAAELARGILSWAPTSRVMVTSREPLRLPGEVVYRVQPLAVPLQDESNTEALKKGAMQLFLNHARSIDRQFAFDEQCISLASTICRRLDGMPLAIELAASRAVTLGIRALADHLDDRFMILTGGYRTALPQHQTLMATFDWSYGLLSAKEQAVLRRLGVFPSAFDLAAATAVGSEGGLGPADVLEAVCALAEKSLLMTEFHSGSVRYRLLETSRAYALRKLADNGEKRRAEQSFLCHVCGRLRAATLALSDPDQAACDDFRTQLDDVRAALHLAFSAHGNTALGTELITMASAFLIELGLCAEVQELARCGLDSLESFEGGKTGDDAHRRLLDTMGGGRQTLALNSRAQVLSLSGADRAHSPYFAELEASPSLS